MSLKAWALVCASTFAVIVAGAIIGTSEFADAAGFAVAAELATRFGESPIHTFTLMKVDELIGSGHFARGDAEVFRPLVENLTQSDPFLVLADYAAYIACQERVSAAWSDRDNWTRMSILNTARSGKFSSDRAIGEYCDAIWNVQPVTVKL